MSTEHQMFHDALMQHEHLVQETHDDHPNDLAGFAHHARDTHHHSGDVRLELADVLLHDVHQTETTTTDNVAAAAAAENNSSSNKRHYEEAAGLMVEGSDTSAGGKRQKTDDSSVQESLEDKKINKEQWEAVFARLKAYKAQHGHCLVPKRYGADPKLGTWVETQRVQYKRLERQFDETTGVETVVPNKRLNQERLEKLVSIGFAWCVPKGLRKSATGTPIPTVWKARRTQLNDYRSLARLCMDDRQWQEMFEKLVKYKDEHGDTLVPRKYEKDPRLAAWVENQRIFLNRDNNRNDAAATAAAAATNLSDAEQLIPTMITMYPEPAAVNLAEQVEEWPVAQSGSEEDSQKHADGHHGGATAEDAALLAAAMGTGEEGMHEMVAVETQEDASAPAGEVGQAVHPGADEDDSAKIPASFLLLPPIRKNKLDALGFVWSLRNKRIDDHWDEMFRQLVEYKEKHGDCLVPSRYDDNIKLGKWVETQRYEYTKLQRVTSNEATDPKGEGEGTAPIGRSNNPRLTQERLKRLESIGFEWKVKNKMKRYFDKQWDQLFERLLKFKEANGHCIVPKRYPLDVKLGTWVHTQRIQHRRMTGGMSGSDVASDNNTDDNIIKSEDDVSFRLTDERRKRLDEISFAWTIRDNNEQRAPEQSHPPPQSSYDDQWDAMFNQLKAHKEKYGDCLVPKRFPENQKLGTWVDTQRVQYKKMTRKLAEQGFSYEAQAEETAGTDTKATLGRLTDERIRRLEELGFVWSLRDDWEKHFKELKEYKSVNGHCNVPARYPANRRLGIWVSAQRQQYKARQKNTKAAPRLTQERIVLLNELEFTWTIRSRDILGESWNLRFQDLKNFKAAHGNCLVPSRYPPNPELGVWVGTQRTQYRLYLKAKEGNKPSGAYTAMTEERIQVLEDIGFVWALRTGDGKKEEDDSDLMDTEPIGQEALDESGTRTVTNVPGGIVAGASDGYTIGEHAETIFHRASLSSR